jgi:hypothetical protein
VSKDKAIELAAAANIPDGQVPFSPMIINTGSKLIAIDTGNHDDPNPRSVAARLTRREMLRLAAGVLSADTTPAKAAPDGHITIGSHVSLAPIWFDPAETLGIITPFMLMYAMHDAMAKAMPGDPIAPCLAESWTMAADGLSYRFLLRSGARFHNGEPVTAEDVKFGLQPWRHRIPRTCTSG